MLRGRSLPRGRACAPSGSEGGCAEGFAGDARQGCARGVYEPSARRCIGRPLAATRWPMMLVGGETLREIASGSSISRPERRLSSAEASRLRSQAPGRDAPGQGRKRMDPQALWDELVKNLREAGEFTNDNARLDARLAAIQGLRDLAKWLHDGGFPPEV